MATDIIDGLFGLSAEQEQFQRQKMLDQAAIQYAKMSPFERATAGMFRGGAQLADLGAGMLGMQNPAIVEAQRRESALAGIDMSNPQSIMKRAEMVQDQRMKMRLKMLAQQVAEKQQEIALKKSQESANLRKAQTEASPFAKINPKDYTQESLRAYMNSGNPSDLEAVSPEGKISQKMMQLKEAYPDNPAIVQQKLRDWIESDIVGSRNKGKVEVTNVMPGQKELKDIPKFRKDVQDTVKPQMETVYASEKALAALDLAMKENNPSAFQVARTQLAKAAGDSQISLREIEAAGGDPSIAGKIMDTTSVLFTGTPTIDTQANMKRTLKAIARVAREKGRKEIDAQRTIAERSGYAAEDLDAALKFDAFSEESVGVGQTVKLKSGKTVKRID